MKKYLLILLSVVLFLSACDLIEYHPYDGRIKGEKGINAKNIARIEKACVGKDVIRFIMMGDTQRWYDEAESFVKSANQKQNIDFVIHGGDLSDFGMTREFEWQRDILNKLNVPYVALLGNHDCLANGEQIFRQIFGDPNFSFMAGSTKFVCLNTNALEYDYSRPVPDFEFMEKEYNAESTTWEKTIFAMHVPPFDEQFNNNVAKVFQRFIQQFPKLQFCVHAHTHKLTATDLFDDGVMYYSPANIKKRTYLIFTINSDDTYDYEVVEF